MKQNFFQEIEHTADVGIEIQADSVNQLFLQAAKAFYFLAIGKTKLSRTVESVDLSLERTTLEELLIEFLNELNFYLMTKFSVLKFSESFNIAETENGYKLSFNSKTSTINPKIINNEIKAATYHQLKINFKSGYYNTKIFFDI